MILLVLIATGLFLWWVAVLWADLVQNTALVIYANPANIVDGTSNVALTAGQPIYTDGTYWYPAGSAGNAVQAGQTGIGINQAMGMISPYSATGSVTRCVIRSCRLPR